MEEVLKDYDRRSDILRHLYRDTISCYQDLKEQGYVDDESGHALLSLEEAKFIKEAANQRPCIVILGEKNCGKSSLINVLLGEKGVPTRDTPCTSRLVRLTYAEHGHVRLLDKHGNERYKKDAPDKREVNQLIALGADDRCDHTEISQVVELALDHPLLKCGLEIMDTPGLNENDKLDSVITDMLERRHLLPVFVYVIDGNQQLRSADRKNIKCLQESCPNATIVYACNKIDLNKNALSMDSDTWDTQTQEDVQPNLKTTELSPEGHSKMENIYSMLRSEGFLPDDNKSVEDMFDNDCFHGISCRAVRKAKKEDDVTNNVYVRMFDRFLRQVAVHLHSGLDSIMTKATDTLLCSFDRCLNFYMQKQGDLVTQIETSRRLLEETKKTELSMFEIMMKFLQSGDTHMKLKDIVETVIARVKPDIITDAETRELPDEFVYDEFKSEPELQTLTMLIQSLTDAKSITAHAFCREVCGVIVNRVTNNIRRETQKLMTTQFSTSMKKVLLTVYALQHPGLVRTLEKAYVSEIDLDGTRKSEKKVTISLLIQIATTLSAGTRKAVMAHLNAAYSTKNVCQIMSKLKQTLRKKKESVWRTRIATELVDSLKAAPLADSIKQACRHHLNEVHNAFTMSLEQLTTLNTQLRKQPQQLRTKIRDLFIPTVAGLEVRAFALNYEIKYGCPQKGTKIGQGSRCQVNKCRDTVNWMHASCDVALKIMKTESCSSRRQRNRTSSRESWQDMMVALHSVRSTKQHSNLLQVYGWVMPEPTKLYIVMERCKMDLVKMPKESLNIQERLQIAMGVANGLSALHDQGIVYADLKPQNILLSVDSDSENWIAVINMSKAPAMFSETALGAPFHIAPFLYEDSKQRRICGDIYAFGMLLWFLLDGNCRRPTAYEKYTTTETMKIAVKEIGVRLEKPEGYDDKELWKLLKQCWSDGENITAKYIHEKLACALKLLD
ncbi:dual serine/threonine and tyrosine protein kinase-like [Glandiceps talaboti]